MMGSTIAWALSGHGHMGSLLRPVAGHRLSPQRRAGCRSLLQNLGPVLCFTRWAAPDTSSPWGPLGPAAQGSLRLLQSLLVLGPTLQQLCQSLGKGAEVTHPSEEREALGHLHR